jgi:methyl-accepting chemotaxis protein
MSANQTKAQHSMQQATNTVAVLSDIKESILTLSSISSDVARSARSVQENMEGMRQQVKDFRVVGDTVGMSSRDTRKEALQLTHNADKLGQVIQQFNLD